MRMKILAGKIEINYGKKEINRKSMRLREYFPAFLGSPSNRIFAQLVGFASAGITTHENLITQARQQFKFSWYVGGVIWARANRVLKAIKNTRRD